MIEVGSKPVVVTALGAQDGGNWTAGTIQVGLWDSEGSTLMAYAFVSNSSPAEAGGYRYSPITPVTLQANTRYIIGALGGTGYANFYDGNNATLPFTSGDSNITIVVSTYNDSDFFSAPTWTAGGGAGGVRWAFANFKFDSGRQLVVWGDSPITTHPVMNAGVSQAVIASQSVDTNVIAVLKYGGVTTWSLTGDPVSALDAPESTLADVVLLAAGEEHFLALKKDGQVVAWGRGFTDEGAVPNFGQSDIPYDASSGMVAVAAGDYHSLALRKDGRVFAWGWDNYNQCQVPDAARSGVVAIAAGRYTSFALKFDGTLVSWGRGSYGATLPADATNGVVAISAGRQHAMALKSDGTVKAWGTNAEGQVTTATGSPAGLSGVTSVAAGRYYSMALKSDRTVQAWGESGYISDSFTAPAALANVVSIQGGRNHGLAIVSDGPAPRLDMPLGPLQILAGSATNLPLKSTVPSPIFSQVGLPAGVALSPAGALSVSNTVASTNVFARIMVENSNGSDARVVKLQITGNTNPIFAANFNDFTGTPTDKQYQTDHDLVSGANLAGWTKTGTDAARLVNHGAAVADWAVMIYSDDTITMASGVDANVNGVVYRVSLDVGPSADKNNSHSTRADEILRVLVLDGEGTEIAGLPVSPGAWAGSQTFVRRTFTYTGNGNGAVFLKLAAANPSASRIAGSVDNITIAVAEADSDGDGYSNELENSLGTDPDLMDPAPTTVGSDFSFDVAWAGDSNFAATGLPAGLTISTTTGRISGVPLGVTAGQGAVVTVTGDSAAGGPQTRKLVIRVDKGSLTLSGITATAIPVSQTLSTSVIEGAAKNASGVTVAGNWEFRNNANKPLAGANSYSVIFRPADGDNYHDAYGIVSVTGTATPLPSVTFLPPLSLVYDNTAKTFTASASGVSGFSYEYRGRNSTIYAATDVAPVNAGDYVVKATSTDPNYSGSAEQDFTITKAPVTLTLGGLNQTYNGSPKLVTVTPNPVGVSFTVQYDGGSTPPRNAGTYPVLVTVTDPNYTGSKSDTLVIAKADPVINTPPTISAITYGETLGAATFTGGAFSPTGTFAFVSPGTTPPAGIGQNFDVLFTPTDTDNYNTGTRTMAITVNPAPLTITGISIANKPFDGTKAATITGTASYAGLVNGETFAVTGTPTAVFLTPDVGNGKAVEVNGYTAPSANYTVTQPSGLTANITATAITDGNVPLSGTTEFAANTNGYTSTGTLRFSLQVPVEYLVVAGGGAGGGRDVAGGGGAGGVLDNVGGTPLLITGNTNLAVTVGAGGTGVSDASGNNGGNSALGSITAVGGGGGGYYTANGQAGGSGGGGGRQAPSAAAGGAGTAGQGNPGGSGANGSTESHSGGGGGGAGAAGQAGSITAGGRGGDGRKVSITGTDVYYGGGGGGSGHRNTSATVISGQGGQGGGGAAAFNGNAVPIAGQANTGGGGGASRNAPGAVGFSGPTAGANGGSGVVMVRYPGGALGTGGTISPLSVGGTNYTLHSFTNTGSATLALTNLSAMGVRLTGVISGPGGIRHQGPGTLTLASASTYSGPTVIDAGATLQLDDGGSLGAGNVTNNGTLVFNRTDTNTFANLISGTGAVWQIGAGTTILTGANSYSGGTLVSDGVLEVGDGGTGGSLGSGPITNNKAVVWNKSSDETYSMLISGTGRFRKSGGGTLTLATTNTYTGPTVVHKGTLKLTQITGHVGNTGYRPLQGTITVQSMGTLTFATNYYNQLGANANGFTQPLTPVILDGGTIESGQTVTTFTNLVINGGKLLGMGGFGNPWGAFVLLGTVNVTADASFEAVSGTDNSITPGAWVGNETVTFQVANGANLTNGLPIEDYGAGNVYSVTKTGGGTLILNATNTYTGATAVNEGVLCVGSTGRINGGTVTVNSGAQVEGSGAINALSIASGGVLKISAVATNSAGAWNTGGSITFASGATVDANAGSLSTEQTHYLIRGSSISGTPTVLNSANFTVSTAGGNLTLIPKDTDGDGLSDFAEGQLGTNPSLTDTDGDGLSDKQETDLGTNPSAADSDGDGLNDNVETGTGTFVAGSGGTQLPVTFTIVTNKITDASDGGTLTSINGGSMSGKIMNGTNEAGEWFLSDFRYTRKAIGGTRTLTGAVFATNTAGNPYPRGGVGMDINTGGNEPDGVMKFSYQVRVSMKPGYRAGQIFLLGRNPTTSRNYGPAGSATGNGGSIKISGFPGTNTGVVGDPNDNLVATEGDTFSSGADLLGYQGAEKSSAQTTWYFRVPATEPVSFSLDLTGQNSASSESTAFSVQVFQEDTGTSPLLADSDGDGVNDGAEVAAGKDPNIAPRAEVRLAALSTGYIVSARRSNAGEIDWSSTTGSMAVGSQRSANGSADAGNQRAGAGFATFRLTSQFLTALSKPGAKFYVELKVDGIGAGTGGVPYTDGLDLRYYGVRDNALLPIDYYNAAGTGGDQSDIVATTASTGVKKVELTQASAISQIPTGAVGQHVGFGFLNSAGVNTSVPVGNSFAETYSFNVSAVPSDFALVVSLPDNDEDGLADAFETNTGTFASATDTGSDPAKADTDGDGVNDGAEVAAGTNPLIKNILRFRPIDMLALGKGNFSIPESNVVGGGVTPTGFVYSSSTNAAYYGGVPFFVTDKANQVWHAAKAPGGDGTGVVSETFPIAVNDVYGFYTMAGLWWGAAGSYVTYTFNFSDGSSYSKILTNNVDLRDFNIPSMWANSINGTTTQNVFAAGTYHLDRQWIDLAAAGHGGKNLVSFTVTDSGSWGSSRIFLAAATAQVGAPGQIPPGATDTDGDGILDSFELGLPLSTKPDDADTDDDGLTDGLEISGTTDPLVADTDGDGLIDGVETKTGTYVSSTNTGTDPAKVDTDGDGLNDNVETASGTFVSAANPGTNPNLADSDGDGVNDGVEIAAGTSPLTKPSFPAGTFSVTFDGTSTQRVISPRPVQDDFTFAFWIKTSQPGTGTTKWFEGRGLIDGEVVGPPPNDFGTSLMAGGKLGLGVGNPDTTLLSSRSVNDNQWHHVVFTREAATGAMRIYVDGLLDQQINGPTGTRSRPPRLTLGSLQTDSNYFAGEMADVRIYDRVISATDIWLLANRLSVAGAASKVTLLVDTDNDGLDDAIDPDPTKPDTDGDGLTDGQEVNTYGSNPSLADTDGDGVNDKAEVDYGTSPTVSTVFNRLINGSFEDGPDKPSSGAIQTTNVIGWKTSATDRMIELWASGFLGSGGNDGAVLAELNAFEVSTLYQDVTMTANSAVSYSFLHRGRDGTDVMEFRLDRLAGGPGSAVEANFFSRTVSTGMSWVRYHGTPPGTVEAGRTYRFSYSSITPAGSTGNLLDAAFFEIDRDADGLTDSVETNTGTYVSAANAGTDPLDDDSDKDGLKDGEEVFTYTTVPTEADSDTDGAPDGVEVTAGSDPKLASSVPKPSISSQPVATTGTVGGSASFTVTAANPAGVTAGPTYQWKKNGEDIPGETTSTLNLPLLAIDSEGSYSVTVANAYGSVTSTDAVLTVNKATPVIETAPLAGSITYGEQLSAVLLAGGVAKVGALEVEGFFSFDSGDFKPAAGTANQDVTFTPLDPDSYNTATLKVPVTVAKKALTVRANDQTRFYGQANPTFTVTYTGLVAGESSITPAPSVTTSANAGSLPGSYAIEVIGPAQTNYDVTFVNGTLTVRDGDQDGDGVGDSAELAAGTDPANPADRPMVLSAGWNHTLFVPVPGQTALAWGINTDGRCGLGHTNSPVTSGVEVVGEDGVTKLSNVIAVAAGGNHSLILTRSGSALQVWAAGTNGNGQLGLTNAGTDRFRPILSGLPTNITAVAAGARHSLALAADGKLYAWGDNISGQVGVNTNRTVIRMPTLVTNLGAVTLKAVRAGAEHSLALDADGKVWSWGRPNGGALGYEGISPVRAPQMVTALTKKIAQIAAGDRHSLFLTEDGEVYASGINTAAQLGLPASVTSTSIPTKLTFPAGTRIKKLVAGLNRAHAIATDGKVYAWGYNRFGELGLGFASNADPFAVFVPTEVPSLFGSTEIAGGGFQTFALDSSGTLLASGLNDGGQLGVGSTNTVTTNAPAPTKQAGKSDQTLTFNISSLTNSTATSIVLNASATSGLTPVYTSSAPAVAAVEGSSLRFLTAGTVRITATQSGNDLYNAAAPVTLQLTVVLDTTLPVVTLNGPATVSLYVGDIFTDPGASALDPADGLLTNDIFVTGTVNTAVVGTYTLTYQVQDAAGNLGQAVRTVVVSEPPPLTLQLAATPAEMTYQPVGTNEVAVDSGLQILGRPSITLTAATVKIVSGRQTGDRLALSGYTGPVTASYNANSGTLRLSGTTNLAGYQEALRKVVLATTNRTFSNRVITMALGAGIAFTNGHVYEFVSTVADWPTARNAAKARQIHGEAGYLANSTSVEENVFLLGLLQEAGRDGWLGGSDTAGTGYRWFDGPEAGTLFWNGVGSGGSAVAGQYSNWGAGEPNDFGWSTGFFSTTYESYAMMTHSTSFVIGGWTRSTSPGKWNDAPIKTSSSSTYRLGYLVEYGSSSTTGLRFAAARTIEVVKATPLITALPTATAITTGQTLNTSTLSGGAASVPGTFAWSVPTTVPPAGTNNYGVTFTPTDTANYEMVALEVPVTAESAPTGPLFASYYNDTYPFSPTVPTLTIVGSNLDLATKGFKLVNTTPLMGEFTLSVLSMDPSQVTLGLPTSMPSGTYYVIYDSSGVDEKILGYLNSSSFAGGGGMGGGTGSGTGGGGGMGPASVPDAMALAEPALALSSGSGGITTLSVGPATVQMLFSYNRPEGGSYVDGRYAVGGLWYEVQQSTNLGSWVGVAAQEVSTIPLENGWERVTVRVSASGNQAFLRLKISN